MSNTILVTGGSGFLADSLVSRLLLNPENKVRLFSRNEGSLIRMKQKYPQVEIFTGDMSDKFEVHQACKGINQVYHLAAFKHVGLAEEFPRECVKSNLIGSLNLLDESLEHETINTVVLISTDKAAQISGVYGSSKFLMERLTKQYETLNPEINYRIVRYGNVLYSTGSVLCKWKELIEANKPCIITEPAATRFYWTREQAVDLIFDCLENAVDSNPYCPTMKSLRIDDLFTAMVKKYGEDYNIEPKIIGLQPGENLHEKILEDGPYSNEVEYYSVEEIMDLI
jgi:UDP-N-acetylglucosamine 4,6-dehydratase/UDP-glucose 4-epimerase